MHLYTDSESPIYSEKGTRSYFWFEDLSRSFCHKHFALFMVPWLNPFRELCSSLLTLVPLVIWTILRNSRDLHHEDGSWLTSITRERHVCHHHQQHHYRYCEKVRREPADFQYRDGVHRVWRETLGYKSKKQVVITQLPRIRKEV